MRGGGCFGCFLVCCLANGHCLVCWGWCWGLGMVLVCVLRFSSFGCLAWVGLLLAYLICGVVFVVFNGLGWFGTLVVSVLQGRFGWCLIVLLGFLFSLG